MGDWIRLALDLVLIACVGAGLVQAARLMRHLSNLQQGREDMERFVREFNATVARAETGIKELRYAARESGDDLEKLVDKAAMARDELQFLVESADQIADRLSQSATQAVQYGEREAEIIPLKDLPKASLKAPLKEAATQAAAMPPHEGKAEMRQQPAAKQAAQAMPRHAAPAGGAGRAAPSPAAAPGAAALSSLAAKIADARAASKVSPAAASRAEQELLQALQNLR